MNCYQEHRSEFLEGLKAFLRIPSISTLAEHKPDIRRADEFARNELAAAGMNAAGLIEGDGNPLVYAEWLGASPRCAAIFARGAVDDKGQILIQFKTCSAAPRPTQFKQSRKSCAR